jgi:glycopeptide antibiotics resistance protein
VLLFCTTVIYRETQPEPECKFHPFWHYSSIRQGVDVEVLLPDAVLNVLVFIPVGLSLCLSFKKRRWLAPFIGFGLSFTIELLQFLFLKGCTDVDDVIHNTLGCLVGCGVYWLVARVWGYMVKGLHA